MAAGFICLSLVLLFDRQLAAQTEPTTTEPTANATAADQAEGGEADEANKLSAETLRVLVAPIALYPDDILGVVLPASTTGLQIVQAQRYLDKHKSDASLKPDKDWDPSVIALLNYPDVVARLNADLDWTSRLGDAVINQQADVMDAIQQIRNEAVASGYLKSDDKQAVTQEKETVIIKSADPQVVYVPTYDSTVVVNQTYAAAPPVAYSPPYPYYYSPAATFFSGMFVGAALSYGFDWDDNDIDIDVDRGDLNINDSFNRNDVDLNKFDIDRKVGQNGDKLSWQGNKKRPSTRPATGNRAAGLKPVSRQGGDSALRAKTGTKARPADNRVQNRAGNMQRSGRSAGSLDNYTPGRQAAHQSNRGQKSLSSRQSAPSRSDFKPAQQRKQGAFSGSRSGSHANVQQSRGNKSLGGRRGGGGRR